MTASTTATRTAWLQIHACVMLWGFTAILGKLITLPSLPLVWWRMLLVSVLLAALPRVWRGLRAMPARLRWAYAGVGVLIALHWLTFYAAIKFSNASVGVACMALVTVLTALIEPVLTGKRMSKREVALGVAALPGMLLVAGGVPADMSLGMAVGGASAVLCAIFGALNKRLVDRADPLAVTAIEMAAGMLALTLLAPAIDAVAAGTPLAALGGHPFVLPTPGDAAWLATLAIACTLLPFVVSLLALRHLSAFAAQLAVSLEPVYAIALASLIFAEQRELTPSFYLGVAIILATVLVYPLLMRPRRTAPEATTASADIAGQVEVGPPAPPR